MHQGPLPFRRLSLAYWLGLVVRGAHCGLKSCQLVVVVGPLSHCGWRPLDLLGITLGQLISDLQREHDGVIDERYREVLRAVVWVGVSRA